MPLTFLHWRSLKVRVTLFTLVIFLISIWSFALYGSHSLRKDMEQLLGEQQFSTVTIVASQIDDEMAHRIKALETSAEKITQAMMDNPTILQARLEDRPVLYTLFNNGVAVGDMGGTVIAEYPPLPGRMGANFKERDYIIGPLKEGEVTIGRPVMSKLMHAPAFVIAVPIFDAQRKVIGVLAGVSDLRLPNFLDKITQGRYGKSGGYLLVSPKHRLIVTASDKRRVMESLPPTGLDPIIERRIQGDEGTATLVNARGENVLSSAKNIPAAGWFLAASLPTEEAFAPIRTMQQRMLLAAILFTLLTGVLTWWMLKRQLSPMLDAVHALAREAGANRSPQPLPIAKHDEIGELIGGFNGLLEVLAQREAALKASELSLRLTEGQMSMSQQISGTGTWVYYLETERIWGSAGSLRIFGFPPECATFTLQSIEACIPERERVHQALRAMITEGRGYDLEYTINPADGSSSKVIHSVAKLENDTQGNPLLVLGFIQDITERVRLEKEKIALEAQFQQAQKMDSVGRLAGGVAHDFNNMLTVIRGNVSLAIEQVDPSQPIHTDLVEIRKAADRSADLTRQLLAFARKQVVAPKVLNLNDTVVSVIKMLQRLIGEDISLAWLPGESLWPVRIDPSQFDQILANLCINARDAIAGVGNIAIETRNSTLDEGYCAAHAGFVPGDYVRISVSDNGHGIDKETLPNIFEPFFTTKGISEGTGLGLATVYGAVKQNNGFINVYSEPGTGTTFTIYLPRHTGDAEEEQGIGTAGQVVRGKETILLVEDEPAILTLTERILTRAGYPVLPARTPGEAVRLASEHVSPIDLLITDVVMPEMNGRDLAKNLLSFYPGLKLLFMSGYTANIIVHQGVLDKGVNFIQKPFSVDDIAAKVREVLDSE